MREFTEDLEGLLQARSKRDFPHVSPYFHGAIYAANPYLLHFMQHARISYLCLCKLGNCTLKQLGECLSCASYGTFKYNDFMETLKKEAKRNGCPIEDLKIQTDEFIKDVEL